MKMPMKYQLLHALTHACNKYGEIELPIESVVEENFPHTPESDIRSLLVELREEGLVSFGLSDGRDIYNFSVDKTARAFLIQLKEDCERAESIRREDRSWQLKNTAIGYGLGFISGVGLMLLKEYFFKP